MKKPILLLLWLLLPMLAYSQAAEFPVPDKLILRSGYTIPCRILSVDEHHYRIRITEDDGITREVDYPRRYVRTVKYGHPNADGESLRRKDARAGSSGFRVRVNGGYSVRMGQLEDPDISHFRSGFVIGIAPGFVFRDGCQEIGISADYRRHGYDYSRLDERVGVNTYFVGPVYTALYPAQKDRSYFGFEAALGYTHSSEKYKSVTLWKIDTYGVKSSFIYRFPLSQKSRENMEFRLTVFGSTFRKAKVDGKRVKFDDRQNLSSVNFTLRVSFGK